MAVNLHDPSQRLLVDPNAPARRERAIDNDTQVPAAGIGPAARGTSSTTTTTSAASAAPVDSTVRVQTPAADDELRAILDAPPPLPASGTHVLSRNERGALDDFLHRTNDGDGALMWDALATMAQSSQRDMHTAGELKNALQTNKVNSKKSEIGTVEGQNAADRRSSATQLGISVVALAASYGGYKAGEAMGGSELGKAFAGSASQVVSTGGNLINKTMGPQAEADKKKVLQMRHQVMQEVFEQGIENAKGNYDEAREQMKLALKILTEHSERATQISTTITRI